MFEDKKDRNLSLYQHNPQNTEMGPEYQVHEISFQRFILLLLPPAKTQDLDGCEMIFSDTCFFDDEAKPVFIAKTTGEDRYGLGGKLT